MAYIERERALQVDFSTLAPYVPNMPPIGRVAGDTPTDAESVVVNINCEVKRWALSASNPS